MPGPVPCCDRKGETVSSLTEALAAIVTTSKVMTAEGDANPSTCTDRFQEARRYHREACQYLMHKQKTAWQQVFNGKHVSRDRAQRLLDELTNAATLHAGWQTSYDEGEANL